MSEPEKMIHTKGHSVRIFITALIVGLIFFGIGFGIKKGHDIKTADYNTVTGEIVDVNIYSAEDQSSTASVVYEYIADGQKYYFTSPVDSDIKTEIGSEVKIKYNPENPDEAVAEDRTDNYYILFMVFGGALLVISFVISVCALFKVSVDLENYIKGILFAITFMGIPICGFIMKMKMNPIAFILSGIAFWLGLFMFIGTVVAILTGENRKNIKDAVCKAVRVLGSIALSGTIVYVVSFTVNNKQVDYALKGKTVLSDSYLSGILGYTEENMPEYIVFEREVVDVSGDCYYFAETPGLASMTLSTEEFRVGEKVYWIEIYGGNTAVCSMDKFCYEGGKMPENSDRYDENGKCYLNEDFIMHYFTAEANETAEVKYVDTQESVLVFEDEKGMSYHLKIDSMQKRYFIDAKKGDIYYWVGTDNGSYVFSDDLYVYDFEDKKQ